MALEKSTGPAALVLTATVARRYYLEGESKSDIAASLGLSRFKVARLIDRALATGLVRIEIDSHGEIDLDLSVRVGAALGLRHCIVMDAPEEDDDTLRSTLGRAAAELLAEILEPGDVLGLSWARSLMAMRASLPQLPRCDVVQLTGSLSLPSDDSPIELVRDVARRSDGEAFFFYAPMVLPDPATAGVLRTQPEIALILNSPGPPMFDDETTAQLMSLVSRGAMGGVMLGTDDCRATYEELSSRGVEFSQLPTEQPYGIDAQLRDPSGNEMRLVQRTDV